MSGREAPARTHAPVSVVLDVVAVLALVGLALLGLATTFQGWDYLVVGLVAASLGVIVALVCLRAPAAVLVAVIPIGAVLLGGPVALREPGLVAGIPDLQTLADVMEGSVTGWGELLATLPFVDLAGPPAMVPFLLGYLAGAVAVSLAIRTTSTGAPALPLLAVLVVVLLLRRPESGELEWYPLVFAGVAIVWIVVRGLEFQVESGDARGGTQGRFSRAVWAALVVALSLAVSVPLTAGSATSSGSTLRGQVGASPELEDLDSPLRRFRTFTKQPVGTPENVHRKLLFTVSNAPRGARVRMLTLDRYDGREWQPGNDTMAGTTQDAFLRMDTLVDNPTQGRPTRTQVSIARAYRSAWVPTVGSLTSLRFLFADAEERRLQLRYNLATSTAVVPVGIERGNDYEFTAIVPRDDLTPSMRPWPGPVLSVVGVRRADELIRRVLVSEASPMRKVFVLARYLRREGRFSNGAGPGESQYDAGHDLERIIDEFLLATRPVGDDEQYAAAMALLANRVGVPARVVVGAVVPRDGRVRGRDVHAWVELRVADGSWRTLATEQFMGDRPPRRVMSPAPRPKVPAAVAVAPEAAPTQPEIEGQAQARQENDADRRNLVLRALPWLLLLLLATVVPLTKLVRRRIRRSRGRPSDRMAAAWTELVDHARDLGIPVAVHGTRPAQARALALVGALGEGAVGDLPQRADDGVFAADEPEGGVVVAYWDQVMRERRQLGRGQPVWRRAWAPFNPVSLLRRSPRSD